jgi:hypothetical protein
MTDQYWNRLLAKYTEMTQLGAAHPSAVFPDPSLGSLLEAPVEGEEDYTPPAVHTRDLPLGRGGRILPDPRVHACDARELQPSACALRMGARGSLGFRRPRGRGR